MPSSQVSVGCLKVEINVSAGIFLGMSNNSGHNWFHLGDKHSKWRKYYFDLSLVGHQEWRVSGTGCER